jgi:arginyl-tRNA--protein-N-Asp/Glu arginylyltransferase
VKLVFSEYKSDYSHYQFPYVVWAFPDRDDTPAELFAQGFLPSSYDMDRFYLCRGVRVSLKEFQPSSENRRILRKGDFISCRLVDREQFELTPQWSKFCISYADLKFGAGVMTESRLERLFSSSIVTHVLIFHDNVKRKDIGLVVLYMESPAAAFYYYSFYDLDYSKNSLGMYMMTKAVSTLSDEMFHHIYLGSCYSRNAMYKTQFKGAQFFNGYRWSDDLEELKFMIQRDASDVDCHLLENEEYIEKFFPSEILKLKDSGFSK